MNTGARGTSLTMIMDRLAKKASKSPKPVSCAPAARAPAVWWRNIWEAEQTGGTISDTATQSQAVRAKTQTRSVPRRGPARSPWCGGRGGRRRRQCHSRQRH